MSDPMQGVFRGFDIAASGLRAELQRSEVASANLGNMHRTGNAENLPYRRKVVQFEEVLAETEDRESGGRARHAAGVTKARIVEDTKTDFPVFHDPGNPLADANGNVLGSNVDLFHELVDLQVIQRSFEANLTALRTYRGMLQNTITNLSR